MRSVLARCITGLAVFALAVAASAGDLPRPEQKEIKKRILDRTWYTRIEVPCATGRHPYGTYQRSLVEVTPEGVNLDADDAHTFTWWHADSTYWGINVNDPVEIDEVDFDDDEVEIEFEGVDSADGESSVLKLLKVESTEDFWAAFNRAFSPRPLQEEHEDWPAEIRQAIAERHLLNGMSKRQVFYITGWPERFETAEQDGKEVEIWFLRQVKGTKISYFYVKAGEETHLPESIRFEDGILVDVVNVGSGRKISLD